MQHKSWKTSPAIKLLVLTTTTFLFSCGARVNTSTLEYYKVALVSVDESVKAGMTYDVTNLPRDCYKDDACIDRRLRKWFTALATVQVASKYLQIAYASKSTEEGVDALVCSVSRLREVNSILLGEQIELPKDYQSFFVYLDSQTRGMTCKIPMERAHDYSSYFT